MENLAIVPVAAINNADSALESLPETVENETEKVVSIPLEKWQEHESMLKAIQEGQNRHIELINHLSDSLAEITRKLEEKTAVEIAAQVAAAETIKRATEEKEENAEKEAETIEEASEESEAETDEAIEPEVKEIADVPSAIERPKKKRSMLSRRR